MKTSEIIRDRQRAQGSNGRQAGLIRPRFLRELVMVPFRGEWIIEGAERIQAIESPGTSSSLSELIDLLDGERTLDELKLVLSETSAEDVVATVSSLHQFGLIEDGAVGSEPEYSNPETLAFLRRYVAVTGANRGGAEAYNRLQNSEVLIFGAADHPTATQRLADLLIKTGIGSVVPFTRRLPSGWRAQSPSITQSMVISLSFSGEDCDWHERLDAWCLNHRFPWLRLVLSKKENYADLGPFFNHERTPCYRCLQAVHFPKRSLGCEFSPDELDAEIAYWTGMAAVEIIYFLSRIGPLATERWVERYDLQQHTSKRLHLLRVPGCSRCRPLLQEPTEDGRREGATGDVNSAIAFEDYISLSSRPRTPSVIQADFARVSSFLMTQFKRMPNSTLLELPRTLSELKRPALGNGEQLIDAHQVITIHDLSTLLMTAAGIRDITEQKVQRWTATAGNLGSVEPFVVVRHVDGLAPGVYFYQSRDHSLARFQQRDGSSDGPEFMRRAVFLDTAELPDVLFIFTGAYHRLERKYGEFAYKLVNLDAGVAVSQLHYIARTLGYSSRTAFRWADDLIEERLNLEPRLEQVTAVAAVYATSDTAKLATQNGNHSLAPPFDHPAQSASDFCELGLREVVERLYWDSRIRERDLSVIPQQRSSSSLTSRRAPSPLRPLPAPDSCGDLTVADVVAERVTVRHFADDAISPAQLAAILDFAQRGDLEQWGQEHLAQPLTFYVLAWNLKQFEPGVYAYDPEEHGLRVVAPARSLHDSFDLFVQPEFASAAVVVWITGNLAAVSARLGPLGHRYLLLRAGSAGHRLWTAAMAVGLSGGITAGVVSGAAREQFGIDGYRETSLVAFATGFEREQFDESLDAAPDEESE